MNRPLISIIIPVYNGIKFLDRCFKTLNDQSYSNLEIIFIDNGSTDGSIKKIKSYCETNSYANLFNCNKRGVGYARNKGIEVSKGEFISFLDVDDEICVDKHQLLMDGLNKYPNVGMVIGETIKQYEDGRSYVLSMHLLNQNVTPAPEAGLIWVKYLYQNPQCGSYMVRSKILKDNNIRFANISYGEDIAFNICIGLEYDVLKIDQNISIYHRHNKSTVSIANQQMSSLERYFQFYEKFALPLFYNKRGKEPFKQAFNESERIAFRILMKLIHVEKKEQYITNLDDLQRKSFISNLMFRKILFNIFPFNMANSLNERLYKIYYN